MAGDEIVALGAGISSTDGRTIETTVENRKMNPGADYRLTLDGEAVLAADGVLNAPSAHWAHFAGVDEHTNVGYWFPQPATVNLRREARTGSWYAISQPYNPKEPITRSYFTLWLDHGKAPMTRRMPTCCCRAATPRRRLLSPQRRVSKFWPIPRRCRPHAIRKRALRVSVSGRLPARWPG